LIQEEQRRTMTLGLTLGLVAAFAYGTTQFLAQKLVTETASPLVTVAFGLLFGTLLLGTINHRRLLEISKTPKKAWVYMTAVGVTSIGGPILVFTALSMSPLILVSPLTAVNPLIALILSRLFLRSLEHISVRIVGGALMVVLGAILVVAGRV